MSRPYGRNVSGKPHPRGHLRDFSAALLTPHIPAMRSWADEHLPDSTQPAESVVVEPLYLDGVLEGISIDGLSLGGGH